MVSEIKKYDILVSGDFRVSLNAGNQLELLNFVYKNINGEEKDSVASSEDRSPNAVHIVYKNPFPEGVIISSILLKGDPQGVFDKFSSIFPNSDIEFESKFIRRVQRVGGLQTQYFIAKQIAEAFTGLPAYRCAAAVVMAYKAVELSDHVDVRKCALRVLEEKILVDLSQCSNEPNHPRRNRDHLTIALLTAKWHIEASMGRYEAMLETLDELISSQSTMSNHFTLALNVSAAFLIRGVIAALRQEGKSQISSLLDGAYHLYCKAVHDSRKAQTLFGELSVSHGNLMSLWRIESGRDQDSTELLAALSAALRVKGSTASRLSDEIAHHFGAFNPIVGSKSPI